MGQRPLLRRRLQLVSLSMLVSLCFVVNDAEERRYFDLNFMGCVRG